MMDVNTLLITLLMELVEKTPDTPKRVLFKGMSDLYADFQQRTTTERPKWNVRVTQEGADVVGLRNDPTIAVLVVFYRDEVRERESLNAFRLYTEDEIAKELVARLSPDKLLLGLPESYTDDESDRLAILLDLVYPSVRRLAEFLLAGKAAIGESLPALGLFRDPHLRLGLPLRQWSAQLRNNHQTAVLRWRDFLEKGGNTIAGRKVMGDARVAMLRQVETDPARRTDVLAQVTLNEALSVLNPPTRLVERIMAAGYTRDRAEELVHAVKTREAGYAGEFNLDKLTPGLPLPESLQHELAKLAPKSRDDEENGAEDEPEADLRRVEFCLEGLLRLARQEHIIFPRQLKLRRTSIDGDAIAIIELGTDDRLHVQLTDEATRTLSMPGASGELLYEIELPTAGTFRFTLGMLPRWLESYAEDWLDKDYWNQAEMLNPVYAPQWRALRERVSALRDVVDPDWKRESTEDQEHEEKDREPNNPIYAIFDLLYFAHRELFDAFLDAWLTVATLPWRDDQLAHKQVEWRSAVDGLLRLGTSQPSDGPIVIFPFYPLRLAWYREVFRQIEAWLVQAVREGRPLVFEPSVLADQLKPVDRPRAIFKGKGQKRLLEAAGEGTFVAFFVPEERRQRARPPIYRARQKLDQFGIMWPFSLNRFHLAFRPADAGKDIYQLLTQQSDVHPEAAYRVRAMVESTGTLTIFDQQLLGTGEDTADLLTQEHHESFLPRIEYAKGRLESADLPSLGAESLPVSETPSAVHIALLVDAFGVDESGFEVVVGQLSKNPHWVNFNRLVGEDSLAAREELCRVDIAAPPYHTGPVNATEQGQTRDLVYVPFSGDRPEYLRILYDSLMASRYHGAFNDGVYFERVHWDVARLQRLHAHADWVLLFDRTLDKTLFEMLSPAGVCLIDYYPNLPGGYRMAISSQRTDAVAWQLAQVLGRFFPDEMDVHRVAGEMLRTLSQFAGGLLLKTLGGGSLAQELLGLYATYRFLIAEGEFVPGQDLLIPLDDYQSWFGRRTQRGRRADLLVLRTPSPDILQMIAVESKWYKQSIGGGFVKDEFGPDGQMRTTVDSLRSLFDPRQERLDKDYWQKTLIALLDTPHPAWDAIRKRLGSGDWTLEVDGIVYIHQYEERDMTALAKHNMELSQETAKYLHFPSDTPLFCLGADASRLRLKARAEIVQQFTITILE